MIVFARASSAHTSAIMAVMEQAFDARYGERWNEGQLNAALLADDRIGEIAFADGAPIGFSLARYAAEEAELLLVAVTPHWQRRGIARMLISRAIDEVRARGAATIFLEVRDGNDAAGMLYASQGFAGVGRRKGYYSGTERGRHDAITMRRCL